VIVYGSVDDDLGTLSPTLVEAEILPCYVKEEKSFLWINRKSRSVTNFFRERRKKKNETKRTYQYDGGKKYFFFFFTHDTRTAGEAAKKLSGYSFGVAQTKRQREKKRKETRGSVTPTALYSYVVVSLISFISTENTNFTFIFSWMIIPFWFSFFFFKLNSTTCPNRYIHSNTEPIH
jgi:hypothetical protein